MLFRSLLLLLLIIAVMVFARVLPLNLQRLIVNEAINLGKIDLLFRYCGFYLVAVIFASGMKYLTNVIQTLISERTTARMRKELYAHILTLPLGFFRKTQPGLMVNALSTELIILHNFQKSRTRFYFKLFNEIHSSLTYAYPHFIDLLIDVVNNFRHRKLWDGHTDDGNY